MVPTDSKHLIKKVSEKTGLSEDICKEIIDTYWKDIRSALVNGKSPRVYVRGLGYFGVSVRRIELKLNKYYELLQNIHAIKNKVFMLQYIPWRISILKNLQEKLFIHREKKRKNGRIRTKIIKDFQAQSSNSGGNIELFL